MEGAGAAVVRREWCRELAKDVVKEVWGTPARACPSKELALCTAGLSRRSERGLATICRRSGGGRE